MSDATETPRPAMPTTLGRNQKIGLSMWGSTMILTFGFMVFGVLKAPEPHLPTVLSAQLSTWVSFVTPFTAICLGVILGGSAGLKVAQLFAAKPKPQ